MDGPVPSFAWLETGAPGMSLGYADTERIRAARLDRPDFAIDDLPRPGVKVGDQAEICRIGEPPHLEPRGGWLANETFPFNWRL
jgi:hypothetical protein